MPRILYLRTAKILAGATAFSLLVAAGPGRGGPGPRQQTGQSQGNQQCPPGQGQSNGNSQQGYAGQNNSNTPMAPVGGGGERGARNENAQNQQPDGPGQGHQNRQGDQGQALTGSVTSYNLNPGGTAESMMLSTANSTVQLNFPPEMAAAVQAAATVGSQVTVTARSGGPDGPGGPGNQTGPGDQQADHDVMNLESIKTASGSSLNVGGPGGGQSSQVTGTVKQLNYDRRGSVDGAQLDTGTFVHLRPGAKADLTVGEKVSVQGRQRTTSTGMKIIEAMSINGKSLGNNGPSGQGGPGGPGNNGGPDGNGHAPGQ